MVEQPDPAELVPHTLTEYWSDPLKPGLGLYRNRKGLCSSVPWAGREPIDADVNSNMAADRKLWMQGPPPARTAVVATESFWAGKNRKGFTRQSAAAAGELQQTSTAPKAAAEIVDRIGNSPRRAQSYVLGASTGGAGGGSGR
jgi:hypothetical protein